ncbi:MAG TPA: alpha/beta hydrolase fold domain-containing protein [Myxococcota bacterium]|nr:alpha/beta hydrolase fold domain-containing protein [Myxococcota bacterium]
MASQEFERLMSAMPGGNVDHRDPVEVVREKMHAIHPTSASPTTLVEADSLDGIEAKWIATPENATSDRIVMHVHGGAFVSTVIDHYLDYGEHLSRHLGARVVCFQWTWADEAPYPRAVEDTLTAYRALLARGHAPSRIAFVGDSCGGGIALAAICALRDAGESMPACLVGLTPWLDAEQTGDAAMHPRGRDPFVTADWIRARFRDYAGPSGDLRDPGVSPIRAKLHDLPPMYLSVGGIDTTADDSTRLAERAGREGVSVVVDVAAEMIHGYVGLCGAFPEATEAMQRVGSWVKQRIP